MLGGGHGVHDVTVRICSAEVRGRGKAAFRRAGFADGNPIIVDDFYLHEAVALLKRRNLVGGAAFEGEERDQDD